MGLTNKIIFGLAAGLLLSAGPALAADQIKTTESYVYDSNSALSSNASQDFSVYIGDNIGEISDPIKSAFFRVSGVYTGSGSLTLTLNSGNSQTYSLPSVANPTYFELMYKDLAAAISPATSGTYAYTLGLAPAGVTIYGLGVILDLTYRYAPAACGTGLPAIGELTSAIFDTTGSETLKPAYNSIMWLGSFAGGTGKVRFQLATSNSPSGPWNYFGSSDNGVTCSSGAWYDPGAADTPAEIACAAANHNSQRYFRYKVQLCSNNDCATPGTISPRVDDVVVNWSP
jgi:hypothetical protein